jgi:hypothetical protein
MEQYGTQFKLCKYWFQRPGSIQLGLGNCCSRFDMAGGFSTVGLLLANFSMLAPSPRTFGLPLTPLPLTSVDHRAPPQTLSRSIPHL